MATYVGYRDGGKTTEQGLKEELKKLFTNGVASIDAPTSLQVVQRAAGANMSVDISIGDAHIFRPDSAYSYWCWQDAVTNQALSASNPSNPRIDVVVAYIDLSVVNPANNNNLGAFKFSVIAGTPAGSPVVPSNATIQATLGANVPWFALTQVAVAANATTIVNANLTDVRPSIAVKAALWGGTSNTKGHTVPNVADDTVVLANATQTLAGKTLTAPLINNPVTTGDTGWQSLGQTPNTVTANGNHSYNLVFNAVNLTGIVSNGMRLRFTRTVAAPTQCTSLNGSTQYFNNTTPAGMTFTNNFVVAAWVKLPSYATGGIASRYNGTSGFVFQTNSTGQLLLQGFNAGSGNLAQLASNQSLPLNKWVHVAAQLDMTSTTNSPTVNYMMIDGVDVPAVVTRGGTNPTALIQAGNLEIGSYNGGTNPFPGKIAQVAIYSAKVTQATILASMHQTLVGTETSLISAYSFNNSLNDLNANANNLTANGSAVATNADSPYAQGATAGILEYGIITANSFSTNTTLTVQVPEGSAIPTSGGVSAVSYASVKVPFGFPAQRGKWQVDMLILSPVNAGTTSANTVINPGGINLNVPVGEWNLKKEITGEVTTSSSTIDFSSGLSTSSSAFTLPRLSSRTIVNEATTSQVQYVSQAKSDTVSFSIATPIYAILYIAATFSLAQFSGSLTAPFHASVISAECAWL